MRLFAEETHPGRSSWRPRVEWTEATWLAAIDASSTCVKGHQLHVEAAIFVQCFNESSMDEAMWALKMVSDPASKVAGVVAAIPVPEGAEAVDTFLAGLRVGDALPAGLKGGRVPLLGDPLPAPDTCRQPAYLDGLRALAKTGLHWEFVCHWTALPHITEVCTSMPEMNFVLDHLGRNCGKPDDFEAWAKEITILARGCPNVVAKLGAIEEWGCREGDPAPYLDLAFREFGLGRVLFESNWFVQEACGFDYGTTVAAVWDALQRCGASADQVAGVFAGNARRVYRLS